MKSDLLAEPLSRESFKDIHNILTNHVNSLSENPLSDLVKFENTDDSFLMERFTSLKNLIDNNSLRLSDLTSEELNDFLLFLKNTPKYSSVFQLMWWETVQMFTIKYMNPNHVCCSSFIKVNPFFSVTLTETISVFCFISRTFPDFYNQPESCPWSSILPEKQFSVLFPDDVAFEVIQLISLVSPSLISPDFIIDATIGSFRAHVRSGAEFILNLNTGNNQIDETIIKDMIDKNENDILNVFGRKDRLMVALDSLYSLLKCFKKRSIDLKHNFSNWTFLLKKIEFALSVVLYHFNDEVDQLNGQNHVVFGVVENIKTLNNKTVIPSLAKDI